MKKLIVLTVCCLLIGSPSHAEGLADVYAAAIGIGVVVTAALVAGSVCTYRAGRETNNTLAKVGYYTASGAQALMIFKIWSFE